MFNPFKTVQARSRKQMRKATTLALGQVAGAMRPKPTKAKARPKSPLKGAGQALNRVNVQPKVSVKPAAKAKPPTATTRSRMPIPRGATFRSLTHEAPFGSLDYKLYLPATATRAERALPLLVMLHGCGQTPDDFATGTGMNALAEELGLIVVYPAQNRHAQQNRCWNWYRRGDQSRVTGEPALLADLTRMVLSTTPADPARVYVAGLSAGASMALILAAAYPDIFAAVGAHSGLSVGSAHDASTAMIAMKHGAPGSRSPAPMPTINFHGENDKVVHVRNGRYVAARAADAYPDLISTARKGRIPDGHPFVRQSHRKGTGKSFTEFWVITGAGHTWSGGSPAGRFTDPAGPDASREMLRFMLQHRTTLKLRKAAARVSAT
ncbi:extracellular catalytic domain type 1 short-chain-length polyhydroxyalkanoate depolymerase [Loktanella sp. M215]|uniref:extracellular catalytic domain type 1 short-chain-length polyhydroxyalkanoate depolymerase n=1 Tax=Loktanella sp. M215 TaxID=2675431 RepID=UPI001F274842|nr:PHB depolymerase family esterase [Loktanella sp. M215]MCF7698015.1 PHB depolymerase family esterase [Loktanella sp. M215]